MIAHFSRAFAIASVVLAAGAILTAGNAHADSLVAGMDRTGVSASPARSFDAYSDGAHNGRRDVFSEGA